MIKLAHIAKERHTPMTPPQAHPVFAQGGTTVFEVFSSLARETGAINLGQGFPDHGEPAEVIAAAAKALETRSNQYPPMMGVPELRQAVADHAARFYNLDVDPMREVMVTSGATEALTAAILTFVQPGDEVVTFEPMYDSYAPMIRRAGGIVRPVRLNGPDWTADPQALEAAFGPRTRAVIVNNPMNPTGKLFSLEELTTIAQLCQRHDVIAIADEVYEHLVFDNQRFTPLISVPGMRERTLRIGSAGKTFSLTGWKVGYITAAPALMGPVSRCHQFLTFTTPPALQYGVAHGLGFGEDYFSALSNRMGAKRDLLAQALTRLGFKLNSCAGTYFLITDISGLAQEGEDDTDFVMRMTKEAGVAAIPVSAFYKNDPPQNLVRFCFCKNDGILDDAVTRLNNHFHATPAKGNG
ncbi:MAG: N-succinyldiaminopimelate aminotransferase [Alphaproteobacteria bacterium]